YHPCGLLMFRSVTSAHKRLSLSGFLISKNYIYHSGHTQKYCCKRGLTLEQSAVKSLSAAVSADEQSQTKVLNFKTKPSSSSGLDIIKSPTCSNTQSLAEIRS
ncbi:MAG: hypothetical protein ACR2KX_19565, partial [Chitinophagaceae bacterium]